MKRLNTALVCTALAFGSAALCGQDHGTAAHLPQQSAQKRQGFADYALGKINPNNTDYGAALDAARSTAVTHTIDDLYFWSNVIAITLLAGVTAVFLFHLRAADKKEIIAATLIAQLWNGRVSDKIEIERRTEQYNALVDEHNAVVERELMAKSQAAPSDDLEADDLKRTVGDLENKPKAGSGAAHIKSSAASETGSSDRSQQQKTVLLERRVEAMQNTERNLKERLNQTTALLEQERQRNQTLKGA